MNQESKRQNAMSNKFRQGPVAAVLIGSVLAIILYLYWASVWQTQQGIAVQKTLSETLSLLVDNEIKSGFIKRRLPPQQGPVSSQAGITPTIATTTVNPKDEFSVADRGFWQGLGATKGHMFDSKLANAIVEFLKQENISTLLELGAGLGDYAKLIKAEGIFISCYDGNPKTQTLSQGRCAVIDLSVPIDFSVHEWILSLEVGEHIPKAFEDVFISNLVKGNRHGMILSWAVEGQGGTSHVNNRNNTYIREKLEKKGYYSDSAAEKALRDAATLGWFKNTIMVFRRKHTEQTFS